jgi:hypothetical protein
MNPVTGAPDASDRLRMMSMWLLGSPPGWTPYVMGEVQLQQAITDQARKDALAALVASTYPVPPAAMEAQPAPFLPYWRVTASIEAGPVLRPAAQDASAYNRVTLSISNSPLALVFTVDPTMSESAFRALVQSQYALIVAASSAPTV